MGSIASHSAGLFQACGTGRGQQVPRSLAHIPVCLDVANNFCQEQKNKFWNSLCMQLCMQGCFVENLPDRTAERPTVGKEKMRHWGWRLPFIVAVIPGSIVTLSHVAATSFDFCLHQRSTSRAGQVLSHQNTSVPRMDLSLYQDDARSWVK